jgi:signal transduction histidine kinase
VQVAYETVGEPRALTPTVDLIVYRVAQESLTNVRKHAGAGARVDLRLRYLAGRVEVEVSDTGSAGAAAAPARPGPGGLGQRGMRERVAAVGGSIEMGPKARGGYLVRASLPTAGSATAPAPSRPREPSRPPEPDAEPEPASAPAPASVPEETRA